MRSRRVLGLSLGTKQIGIAVIERNSIFYCQTKSFKASWSEHKLQAILAAIERHITTHTLSAIALKIPPPHFHTPAIIQLLHCLQAVAISQQVPLHTYTLHSLKHHWIPNDQRMNKKQFMKAVLDKYNLAHVYQKEMKNKNRYYEKVFEAVGVADIVLREH